MNNYIERLKKFMTVKFSVILVAVILLAAIGYGYRGLVVAATVDGSPISRLSVIRMLEKQSGKIVLDNLITEKLIASEAEKRGISIPKEEIDAVVSDIEKQVGAQGQTLDQALSMRNMTREDLISQITLEKELQKILSDQIQVSGSDIDNFIKENKITPPKGEEADFRKNVEDQLRQQKLSSEANVFITSLKEKASIGRFVDY
ncbi:hypothetical protein A3H65_01440 [Candidatus Giovannonibacteria bacterium RIFCSPLOWO2_02_FULL_45_14]|uniref:peptidylprolyl isomerase n=1 Tax=Candidatus Giovannonibacteria bacterium RIFCSPLOWO2_12_FULL_44_15 TaxID=1798364 RepID=A0A1F5XZ99_9BACT|nr:MAG: hypothetical protein A3C75_03340 [Candidatus Giovannonibacteria bacterium RIFCSPHIGHO2_02_FULL_44_31]OGF77055.1 MAG: hypothetical protein A3E62_02515 [Candidatus Giovannonibacteria bacterium RIFCSPHIGHO2_12_FULL_44_29]OGF90808.1 MAG: hypothetical protein A3H65_01440 [Candidatus Giovannonibacteria bacterium RIFCSPLOWO2_02_FULL_45_14]OGF93234.1 MAG: hypothetical protein A3G54_01355 [Candidatus Giovannonibacteria bacterium RIFCSPLOWO2_12_FULL_44_15]